MVKSHISRSFFPAFSVIQRKKNMKDKWQQSNMKNREENGQKEEEIRQNDTINLAHKEELGCFRVNECETTENIYLYKTSHLPMERKTKEIYVHWKCSWCVCVNSMVGKCCVSVSSIGGVGVCLFKGLKAWETGAPSRIKWDECSRWLAMETNHGVVGIDSQH